MDVSQPSNTKINSSSVSDDDKNNKEQISLHQDTDINTPKPESRRLTLEDKKAALAARSLAGRPRRPTGSRPPPLRSPATEGETKAATKASTVHEDQCPRRTVLRQSTPPRSGPTDSDQDTREDPERERNITMDDKRAALESRLQRGRPRHSPQPPRVSELETTATRDNKRRDTLRQSAPQLSRNAPPNSDQGSDDPKGKRNIITMDDKRAALESKLQLGRPRRSVEPSRAPATDATATHEDQGPRRDVLRQSVPPRSRNKSSDSGHGSDEPQRERVITMHDKRAALESRVHSVRRSAQSSREPAPSQETKNMEMVSTHQGESAVRPNNIPTANPLQYIPPSNLIDTKASIAAAVVNNQTEKRSLLRQSVPRPHTSHDSAQEDIKARKRDGGITMLDKRTALESRLQMGRPTSPRCRVRLYEGTNAENNWSVVESNFYRTHIPSADAAVTPNDLAQAEFPTIVATRENPDVRNSRLRRSDPLELETSLVASGPKEDSDGSQKDRVLTFDDKRVALASRLRRGRHRPSFLPHRWPSQEASRNPGGPDHGPAARTLATPTTLFGAQASIGSASRENTGEQDHLCRRSATPENEKPDHGEGVYLKDPPCAANPRYSLNKFSIDDADETIGEIGMEQSLTNLDTNEHCQQKIAPGAFAVGSTSDPSLVLSFRSNMSGVTLNYQSSQKSWKSNESSGIAFLAEPNEADGLAKAVIVEEENPFMPAAIEFNPDANGKKSECYRRLLPVALFIFAIIGGIVVACLLFRDRIPTETMRVTELREVLRIYEVFDETSPAFRKALTWISNVDGLTLESDHPLLLQRFVLAHFYYTTTVDGNWTVCNPPKFDEDAFCRGLIAGSGHRWLTSTPECSWVGIKCDSKNKTIIIDCLRMGLNGHVPNYLVLLSEMEHIALSGNRLEGQIPALLPRRIKSLAFGDNSLTGTLPSNLASYRSLTLLELSRNNLSGRIPAELPGGLVELNLFQNSLTGSIPSSVYNLHKLVSLRLDYNSLTGSIASHVSGLSLLKAFIVGSNMLSGSIPDQLCCLSNLEKLIVSHNNISGHLSEQTRKLTKLVTLDLRANHISGTVPPDHGEYLHLNWVFFSGNDLVGSIPEVFCPRRVGDILEADCKPDHDGAVEVLCPCCSSCCNNNGKQCHGSNS